MPNNYLANIDELIKLLREKLHLKINEEIFRIKIREFAKVNSLAEMEMENGNFSKGNIQLIGKVEDEGGTKFKIEFNFNSIILIDEYFFDIEEIKLDDVVAWSH